MNATGERIVELCGTLRLYGDRLEELRASTSTALSEFAESCASEPLWGGTIGSAHNPSTGAALWYHVLDPLYVELDRLIRSASSSLYDAVFSDERVLAAESSLHRLRAAYEYDKEIAQAHAILAKPDSATQLARLIEKESYWALGPELPQILLGCQNILVAGSGPVPLSALSIAATLKARVTCLEQDPEAFELGKCVIERSDYGQTATCIKADIVDLDTFDDYDAILGVVLLGVDVRGRSDSRKSKIAKHVLDRIRPNVSFVFREPHGLGRLLYPAMNLNTNREIEVTRWVPTVAPEHPYRSALFVAHRIIREPRHAQPGTIPICP